MEYLGNGNYRMFTSQNQEIICSEAEMQEVIVEMQATLGFNSKRGLHLETAPSEVMWAESAKFELLRMEIKDSGYADVQWSAELEDMFDTVIDETLDKARDYYEDTHYFMRKTA